MGWSCDKELEGEMKDYNQTALEFLQKWVDPDAKPTWAMTIVLQKLLYETVYVVLKERNEGRLDEI